MSKFQSPSKYSPFDTIHLSRCFFRHSKLFLNLSILMPFSATAIFCFTSSIWTKCFPLIIFFIWEDTENLLRARVGMSRQGGAQGSCNFCSKSAEHSAKCGQVCLLVTRHKMGKWVETVLKKKFTEAKHSPSQHHQLVHWYTRVPRTLTWQGKPVPQGAHPPEDNSCFLRGRIISAI